MFLRIEVEKGQQCEKEQARNKKAEYTVVTRRHQKSYKHVQKKVRKNRNKDMEPTSRKSEAACVANLQLRLTTSPSLIAHKSCCFDAKWLPRGNVPLPRKPLAGIRQLPAPCCSKHHPTALKLTIRQTRCIHCHQFSCPLTAALDLLNSAAVKSVYFSGTMRSLAILEKVAPN